MLQSDKIAELIAKHIKGTTSEAEQQELERWTNSNPDNRALLERSKNTRHQLKKLEQYNSYNSQGVWRKVEANVFGKKTIQLHKFYKYAAAILLPLIIGASVAVYFHNQRPEVRLAKIDEHIQPGANKATLVLSNGNSVNLEQQAENINIRETGADIKQNKDKLVYTKKIDEKEPKQIAYNLLKTPRGGGFNLQLADGTEVWLNAASELRYPVNFTDSTRKVFLRGEAYFKVIHNSKPFIVTAADATVRVLGTSFNVNAYTEDEQTTATLVEGSISFSTSTQEMRIKPNEQATVLGSSSNIMVEQVNPSLYTSWVSGIIEFSNSDLESVMRKLARWYNFEYQFENEAAKNYHFSARINNSEKLSDLLNMIELTTEVKFKLKESIVVIK